MTDMHQDFSRDFVLEQRVELLMMIPKPKTTNRCTNLGRGELLLGRLSEVP